MKRAEAAEEAWIAMAEAYPPLAVEPVPKPVALDEQADDVSEDGPWQEFLDVSGHAVDEWQARYDVTLTDEAYRALTGPILISFWVNGFKKNVPPVDSYPRIFDPPTEPS
jgi:hypothetical protein